MLSASSTVHFPSEIASSIARYLRQGDLYNCILVCRNWWQRFEPILYQKPSFSRQTSIDNFFSTIQQRANIDRAATTACPPPGFNLNALTIYANLTGNNESTEFLFDIPAMVPPCLMLRQLPIKKLTIYDIKSPHCVGSILMQGYNLERVDLHSVSGYHVLGYLGVIHFFCAELRHLEIISTTFLQVDDHDVDALSLAAISLRNWLSLSNSSAFTNDNPSTLETLRISLPKLSFGMIDQPSRHIMSFISQKYPSLTILEINDRNFSNTPDNEEITFLISAFRNILQVCKHLHTIWVTWLHRDHFNQLARLFCSAHNLKSIMLGNATPLEEMELPNLLRLFTELEATAISKDIIFYSKCSSDNDCCISGDLIQVLEIHPNLSNARLSYNMSAYDDENRYVYRSPEAVLAQLTFLKNLTIFNGTLSIPEQSFSVLHGHHLKHLSLQYLSAKSNDAFSNLLQHCPYLEKIRMFRCSGTGSNGVVIDAPQHHFKSITLKACCTANNRGSLTTVANINMHQEQFETTYEQAYFLWNPSPYILAAMNDFLEFFEEPASDSTTSFKRLTDAQVTSLSENLNNNKGSFQGIYFPLDLQDLQPELDGLSSEQLVDECLQKIRRSGCLRITCASAQKIEIDDMLFVSNGHFLA